MTITEDAILTPVDLFLEERQSLTAVEQFSRLHEQDELPAQAGRYSALMPAAAPGPGEQYAFEVDLDSCSGCKACVTACHALNGLDEEETWRDVGMLHGGSSELPVLQHITSACHHCLDPACLNVCPVNAYDKEPQTGIVRHLDDQCIGCQYCVLACPYDVPKYNPSKGIVRKCDMCTDRLAVGEAPACVQACPHEAIRITVVTHEEVVENCETNFFLPDTPAPNHTFPTTRYQTSNVLPRDLLAADHHAVKPEHAHWSLIVMLVLSQLSVGAFLLEFLVNSLAGSEWVNGMRPWNAAAALLVGLSALGIGTFHLGRPLYAFRAVIGLKHSWLSREILAFGLFALLAAAYTVSLWLPGGGESSALLQSWFGKAVVVTGLIGVACSIMIYQVIRRPFWNGPTTGFKFLSTTLLLGTATFLLTSTATAIVAGTPPAEGIVTKWGTGLCQLLIVGTVAKLLFEGLIFRHLRDEQHTPLKRSARLMAGELAAATKVRFAVGILSGIVLPAALLLGGSWSVERGPDAIIAGTAVVLLFAGCLLGELLERYLFFRAVTAPRMPGGLTP